MTAAGTAFPSSSPAQATGWLFPIKKNALSLITACPACPALPACLQIRLVDADNGIISSGVDFITMTDVDTQITKSR
jgi:hypothetical protein